MREMSVTEQRYKAVLAVIGDGRTVGEVARDWGISRRTIDGSPQFGEVLGMVGMCGSPAKLVLVTDLGSGRDTERRL
jgi:hypothetical protein